MKEEKIIDLNKRRKKLNYKKILSALKIPIVILAVIAALLLSARLVGKVAMSNITDSLRQIKTIFSKGQGFPYTIGDTDVQKIEAIGNRIMIIGEEEGRVLDRKAGELYKFRLLSEKSKVITFNGRALVYSNGSQKVVMQSKTEELGSIEEDGDVITATIAKNGWFATSYSVEGSQSVLTVYNNRFEKEFVWNCSNERINAIALSPNGKSVAISAMGVENAEIYSRVIIFNTKEAKPVYDSKVKGTLFLEIYFPSKDAVVAVGDNKTLVLGTDGKKTDELNYTENSFLFSEADEKGNVAVCCSEFGGTKSLITVFKKDGSKACSISVQGTPASIDIGSKKVAVIVGNEIIVYNFKGEEKKRIQTAEIAEKVLICSGKFFTVEGGKICKYK